MEQVFLNDNDFFKSNKGIREGGTLEKARNTYQEGEFRVNKRGIKYQKVGGKWKYVGKEKAGATTPTPKKEKKKTLSRAERSKITRMLAQGDSVKSIADQRRLPLSAVKEVADSIKEAKKKKTGWKKGDPIPTKPFAGRKKEEKKPKVRPLGRASIRQYAKAALRDAMMEVGGIYDKILSSPRAESMLNKMTQDNHLNLQGAPNVNKMKKAFLKYENHNVPGGFKLTPVPSVMGKDVFKISQNI